MKKCVLAVDDRLFCREAVIKAAYLFLDDYYVYLSYSSEHQISISIEAKPASDMAGVDKRFGNELIAQMARYQLTVSNKEMKDLIIGRALYSTCIDTTDTMQPETENVDLDLPSLDDIATDWFDLYETGN